MNYTLLVRSLTAGGMTQKQIAMLAGVSQAAISSIERGITKDPRASIAAALVNMAQRRK